MFDICGSPSRKLQDVGHQAHEKEFHDGRIREFKPFEVGVQIPRGIHPEVWVLHRRRILPAEWHLLEAATAMIPSLAVQGR
jgi:hypothetical protein